MRSIHSPYNGKRGGGGMSTRRRWSAKLKRSHAPLCAEATRNTFGQEVMAGETGAGVGVGILKAEHGDQDQHLEMLDARQNRPGLLVKGRLVRLNAAKAEVGEDLDQAHDRLRVGLRPQEVEQEQDPQNSNLRAGGGVKRRRGWGRRRIQTCC